MSEHQSHQPVEEGQKPSIFGVIVNPGEQFTRIKHQPKILVPFFIVFFLYGIAGAVAAFGTDFRLLIPDAPAEELEFMLQMEPFIRATMFVGILAVPIVGTLIVSFLLWIVGKIVHSEAGFAHFVSMNLFIMFVAGLGVLFNSIIATMFGMNPEQIVTSLSTVLQIEGALGVLLSGIEVFTIWGIILTAIGLKRTADFNGALAWSIAIAFTLIPLLLSAALVTVGGGMF